MQGTSSEPSKHDGTCCGFSVLMCWNRHLKSSVSKTEKDMGKPWAAVGAPDYEATMSLLEEIRLPPFSGCAHTLE